MLLKLRSSSIVLKLRPSRVASNASVYFTDESPEDADPVPTVYQASNSPAMKVLASPLCGVLKNDNAGPDSMARPR